MIFDGVKVEDLPESLREMAEACGVEAVMKLAEAFGGIKIKPPTRERLRQDHPLSAAIGWKAAQWLSSRFGADGLYVPSLSRLQREARDAEIVRRYGAGETVKALVRTFRLSERHIWKILGRPTGPITVRRQ
ncbi:MAG: hypothetical protein HQL64_11660 [Magnetococcales bacterium]|nr:hypothetical protein [Magnetococcales bacterium]